MLIYVFTDVFLFQNITTNIIRVRTSPGLSFFQKSTMLFISTMYLHRLAS